MHYLIRKILTCVSSASNILATFLSCDANNQILRLNINVPLVLFANRGIKHRHETESVFVRVCVMHTHCDCNFVYSLFSCISIPSHTFILSIIVHYMYKTSFITVFVARTTMRIVSLFLLTIENRCQPYVSKKNGA